MKHVQIYPRLMKQACIWQHVTECGPESLILVERFLPFMEHRVFVTSAGGFAVLHRDPAHVVGDEHSTVRQLAETESERRCAVHRERGTSLCPITLDREAADHLRALGLYDGFDHIPAEGKKLYLRLSSNLAKGGVSVDMTDKVHPSVRDIAYRAITVFRGLPCIGLDFMCADITQPQEVGTYAIIEVNSNPGLAMHMLPGIGQPRDVAGMLADVMFPWIPG